ncbi:MAG TPA: exodeoxyribonuclease III, partial [Epsilonproteobacteria bacterium]|nr:exodeoxyribonuclease III [Campylobacterota bacterium]
MTFISWNVNGIRSIDKKEALKWIDHEKIDILALQEIKAEDHQVPDPIFDRNFR